MAKTFARSFWPSGGKNSDLFEVRAGIDRDAAIESASTLLQSALAVLSQVAADSGDAKAWAAHTLVEAARAVVDAATCYAGDAQ